LVRMGGKDRAKENWLLIKGKDQFARPGAAGAEEEKPAATPRSKARKAPTRQATARLSETTPAPEEGVTFTNLDRVMYPDVGITKGDVVDYYRRVAPRLLPFLKDRPCTLERLPAGLGEGVPHFWQKNTPASYPDWVPRVERPSEQGKPVHYVLVNDEETLLYLVNQGTLTFHPWMSRVAELDRPDYVLFDLDPGGAA